MNSSFIGSRYQTYFKVLASENTGQTPCAPAAAGTLVQVGKKQTD
jgi:hypothetical protein